MRHLSAGEPARRVWRLVTHIGLSQVEAGEYEAKLVDEYCEPSGARPAPTKAATATFNTKTSALDANLVCALLEVCRGALTGSLLSATAEAMSSVSEAAGSVCCITQEKLELDDGDPDSWKHALVSPTTTTTCRRRQHIES